MQTPTRIIPAVIPTSLAHLRATLAVAGSFSREVQIDIVDGVLAPYESWPYTEPDASVADMRDAVPTDMRVEFDLMLAHPQETLPAWLALGPARVVLHVESFADDMPALAGAIMAVRSAGAAAVLAIGNDTPLDVLLPYLPSIDGVQCMGIAHIGAQGQPFDERVIERVRTLRAEHPDLSISIDGAVNEQTIVRLRDAGADRFVIGSAIVGAHEPAVAHEQLVRMLSA